jgi:hypothetical protein
VRCRATHATKAAPPGTPPVTTLLGVAPFPNLVRYLTLVTPRAPLISGRVVHESCACALIENDCLRLRTALTGSCAKINNGPNNQL